MSKNPATVDYGTDISGTFRVSGQLPYPDGSVRSVYGYAPTPDFAEVSGRDLLSEALVRRLVTARGTLLGDPDYGTDVRDWLNDDIDAASAARLGGVVVAELQKDERVISASCVATFANDVLTLAITVTDGAGPFPLTLQVTATAIKIVKGSIK
jgi:hypothetical protein